VLDDICDATGCTRQQVVAVVGKAFEALHKIAFCDEMGISGAMGDCQDQFGSKACYHLVGLLDEARRCKGDEIDVPWRETYLRFSGLSYREFDPVVEGWWMSERSEARKLLDERRKIWGH
jgi:hypothetical protein